MSSSVAPFHVDANTKGSNTRIDYHFTSGRTVKGSVVIQVISLKETFKRSGTISKTAACSTRSDLDCPICFRRCPALGTVMK